MGDPMKKYIITLFVILAALLLCLASCRPGTVEPVPTPGDIEPVFTPGNVEPVSTPGSTEDVTPTPEPTEEPTAIPTSTPTEEPTKEPDAEPTDAPAATEAPQKKGCGSALGGISAFVVLAAAGFGAALAIPRRNRGKKE